MLIRLARVSIAKGSAKKKKEKRGKNGAQDGVRATYTRRTIDNSC